MNLKKLLSALFLFAESVCAQEHKMASFPINFDIDLGGVGPTGPTRTAYSPSFMVGAGANMPLKKWFTLDLANLDFGFGNAGGSRIVTLTDNSKRSTANYTLFFTSGPRLSVPLSRSGSGRLEFGGGYAGVLHKEYGVGNVSYIGNTTITEQIQCNDCFRTWGSGAYATVQLSTRNSYSRGGGLFIKYYDVTDTGKSYSPYLQFPSRQRWLVAGANFTFGFGK